MSNLAFCDYHNMVAILEKIEHNTDFHQIVDFLKSSPLTYALLVCPTIYVSHIRQFWSPTRIKTADGETHIIAKINSKQVTVSKSSIRRKLKLKDEEGISDLPDTDLFANLSRVVYNILPNQRFLFQKEPIPHKTTPLTSSQEPSSKQILTPSHTPIPRRLTKRATRIAWSKSLTPGADEPATPPRDESHREAFPTSTSLDAGQNRKNIPKTSDMPHESSPRVTSLSGDGGSLQLKLNELGGMMDQGEDFNIERDSNKSTDKGSESTGGMANVLSSMGACNLLVPVKSSQISRKGSLKFRKIKHQQNKLVHPMTAKGNLYTSVLRSHAGWKTKDFKGMTFKQIEETFILVWKAYKFFYGIPSSESEDSRGPCTLLEKERARDLRKHIEMLPNNSLKGINMLKKKTVDLDRDDMVTLWQAGPKIAHVLNPACYCWSMDYLHALMIVDYAHFIKTTLHKMLDHSLIKEVSSLGRMSGIKMLRHFLLLVIWFPLLEIFPTVSVSLPLPRFPLLEDFPLLIEDKDYSESKTRIVMFGMYL
ncbi:hypothetical protein Tco_0347259 [Tanacetum coccineum]